MSNNTTVIVNVHNTSTEILLVVSSTVFYLLLFLMLKNGLVDKRGMLSSKERINEDMVQIMAIFFAIFVLIAILMIPIDSYEYAMFVVPITYVIMVSIVAWEIHGVYHTPPERVIDVESSSDDKPSKGWVGFVAGSSSSQATKRPVNF